MRWQVLLLGLVPGVLAVACGGSPTAPPTPTGPPASLAATAAPDDVQVATVNGRPVWGSCVTAQSARGADRAEALRQCVDFELMAQEAEARGLATDPEVVLATRTALVSQLVASAYEDHYTRPEDFGSFWTRSLARNRMRFDHPEARGSVYVRIDVPEQATPEAVQAAKQQIDRVYAALANERGLMKPHVEEIAKQATDAKLSIAQVPPGLRHGRLDESYAAPLFAIPEIGRVSPPVRTPWGWDIILWDSVVPAIHATPDEVVAAALPEIKRAYFPQWVNSIAKNLGVHIQIVEKNVPLLENL